MKIERILRKHTIVQLAGQDVVLLADVRVAAEETTWAGIQAAIGSDDEPLVKQQPRKLKVDPGNKPTH